MDLSHGDDGFNICTLVEQVNGARGTVAGIVVDPTGTRTVYNIIIIIYISGVFH